MITINRKNLFSVLKKYLCDTPTIVEAGAFIGQDTREMSRSWPNGQVHAFEPVPDIFEQLSIHTANCPNVHLHNIALSNKDGFSSFFVAEHPKKPGIPCQAGSLHKPTGRLCLSPITYPQEIVVPTITLHSWALKQSISRIDFLWLDMQGHEFNVLQSSTEILKDIKLLYLEVNFIEAYQNQPTHNEINEWLIKQNFTPIAQDFSEKPNWFFGNILYLNNKFR